MTLSRVQIATGGGGGPAFSDSLAIAAHFSVSESNAVPVDISNYALQANYAESNAVPAEAERLILAGPAFADTSAAQSESLKAGITQPDTVAAQTEAAKLAMFGFDDTVAGQTETAKASLAGAGLGESNLVPAEGRTAVTFTYATTQVSVGNGATNGANATGQNDAANASITTVALGATTCSVTPKIPRASVPNAGTYKLFAWYKTTTGLAGAAGLTLTYTDTGGSPVTITLTQGDFSVTPFQTTITSLHATNDITVLFQVTDAAAGVSPGIILVDAVAIQTEGAF